MPPVAALPPVAPAARHVHSQYHMATDEQARRAFALSEACTDPSHGRFGIFGGQITARLTVLLLAEVLLAGMYTISYDVEALSTCCAGRRRSVAAGDAGERRFARHRGRG